MHRARTLTMAATAALALTTAPALAGGPPIAMPIDRTAPTTVFQLAGPADFQDLKISARAGQDLFLGMQTLFGEHAQVFDPSGKPLVGVDGFEGSQGAEDRGVELHPLTTGVYTVHVAPAAGADPAGFPAIVEIWAWPDCRGDPATGCVIAAGRTRHGTFGAANDDDAFRVVAPAGQRYVATLDIAGTYAALLELVDRHGRVLAYQGTGLGASRRFHAGVKFTLPASGGPYFLKASATAEQHAGRGTFALALARG